MSDLNKFLSSDIDSLIYNCAEGIKLIRFSLLTNVKDPFHSICALVSSFPSSPNARKTSVKQLFASFAGIIISRKKELPLNVAIPYIELANGMYRIYIL